MLSGHLMRAKVDVAWQEDHVVVREAHALPKQLGRRQTCGSRASSAVHRGSRWSVVSSWIVEDSASAYRLQHRLVSSSCCSCVVAEVLRGIRGSKSRKVGAVGCACRTRQNMADVPCR